MFVDNIMMPRPYNPADHADEAIAIYYHNSTTTIMPDDEPNTTSVPITDPPCTWILYQTLGSSK